MAEDLKPLIIIKIKPASKSQNNHPISNEESEKANFWNYYTHIKNEEKYTEANIKEHENKIRVTFGEELTPLILFFA